MCTSGGLVVAIRFIVIFIADIHNVHQLFKTLAHRFPFLRQKRNETGSIAVCATRQNVLTILRCSFCKWGPSHDGESSQLEEMLVAAGNGVPWLDP